jgi:hypothetical protein
VKSTRKSGQGLPSPIHQTTFYNLFCGSGFGGQVTSSRALSAWMEEINHIKTLSFQDKIKFFALYNGK